MFDTIAQLGLGAGFDPLGSMLGCAILLFGLGAAISGLVMAVLVLRGRGSPRIAFLVGFGTWLVFAFLLFERLSTRVILPTVIVAIEYAISIAGVLAMAAGLYGLFKMQSPRRWVMPAGALVLAGVAASAYLLTLWIDMERRDNLFHAVLREDLRRAREMVGKGAISHPADRAFRQRMLVHAARDANPALVELFVSAGADVNAPDEGRNALLSAIGSDPVLRLNRIEREEHARRRLATVRFLLEHGAKLSPSEADQAAVAAMLWRIDDADLSAYLKQYGPDPAAVQSDFEALMAAAAGGDTNRVKSLIAKYGGFPQRALDGRRAPLVVAAANGHLDVVEVLLGAYGGTVKCDLIWEAGKAAAEAQHTDVVKRLAKICS